MGMEELPARQATVPVGAVGVEDLQVDLPPRRAEAVLRHAHFDALPDHLAAEPDPGTTGEFQAQAARFDERPVESATQRGGLEDDEERFRSPGEGRQSTDRLGAVAPPCQPRPTEVDDEQVDGARLEERRGHGQALVEMARSKDHEPLQVDPPSDRLDRVERAGRVEVGDDRPAGLRLRTEPQGEGRLPARNVPFQGRRRGAGQATRAEDRIKDREARRHDRAVAHTCAGTGILDVSHASPAQHPVPPLLGEVADGAIEGQRGAAHRTSQYRTDVRLRQDGPTGPTGSCRPLETVGKGWAEEPPDPR